MSCVGPQGRIADYRPEATFTVKFSAIVLKPFKGEVLDSVVTQVIEVRRAELFPRLTEAGNGSLASSPRQDHSPSLSPSRFDALASL